MNKTVSTPPLACCQVLSDLSEIGFDSDRIFEWANHVEPVIRRNRMQVFSSMPALTPVLALSPESFNDMAVETMIDRGDPLIEGLAEIFGVTRSSVRHLVGKSPMLIGKEWIQQPIALLRALDLLNQNSFPEERCDWLYLRQFWVGCGYSSVENYAKNKSAFLGSTNPAMQHIFAGLCSSGYAVSHRKLAKLWGSDLTPLRDLDAYFNYVSLWCKAGAGSGALNAKVADQAERIVSVELLQRYSVKSLIEQSEFWHFLLQGHISEIFDNSSEVFQWEWPALPGLPWHWENLHAVALTNSRSLAEEGEKLNHCVASYADPCLLGRSHIISIRNDADMSCSTVELRLGTDPTHPERITPFVAQHKATNNMEPEPRCVEFLKLLLNKWDQDAFQDGFKALLAFHDAPERQAMAEARQIKREECSIEVMSEIMRDVLPDYELAHLWVASRLQEVEGCYRSQQARIHGCCTSHGGYDEMDSLYAAQIMTNERSYRL